MEKLKAKRRSRRGQNTTIINEATTALPTADVHQLTALLHRLQASNDELRKINDDLEDHLAEETFETEYTEAVEYDDRAMNTIGLLKARIGASQSTTPAVHSVESTQAPLPTPKHSGIRLPKLHLESFNGELANWQSFWECFRETVHDNRGLSKAEKFHYLKSLLTGPASSAVRGLQATEACYDDAVQILQRRFGDKGRIEQEHLAKLRTLPSVSSSGDVRGLRRLYDHVQAHISGLKGLGVTSHAYSAMLCDIILTALPRDMVVEFHRLTSRATKTGVSSPYDSSPPSPEQQSSASTPTTEKSDSRLNEVLEFLLVETECRERCKQDPVVVAEKRPLYKDSLGKRPKQQSASAAVLYAQSEKTEKCAFCDSNKHGTEACTAALTSQQKTEKLAKAKRCFRCTKWGHRSKDCRRKISCGNCERRHATSMCNPNWAADKTDSPTEVTATNVHAAASGIETKETALQTFRAFAVGDSKYGYIRGVMDGGSQKTFIREDVSKTLELKILGRSDFHLNTFGKSAAQVQSCRLVEVRLRSQYGGQETTIEAVEVPFICKDVKQVPADHGFVKNIETQGALIADKLVYPGRSSVPGIALLIGADHLWKFQTGEVQRCEETEGLAAINTKFGWTVQGPFSVTSYLTLANNICVLRVGLETADKLETTLQHFWELDAIGIKDSSETANARPLEKVHLDKKGQRYEVALPWKDASSELSDNKSMAMLRLASLTKRLCRNKELAEQYDTAIRSYFEAGHAERVSEERPPSNVYYMPHQPVLRNEAATTKLRVVFDASSHAPGKQSLNDQLEKGPNLVSDLVQILLRFRLHKVALVADIEKAFLQIAVRPEDRDALRFFWYSSPPVDPFALPSIEEWRMTRVPFGTTASPYLLTATLLHHLESQTEEVQKTASLMKDSFYVDDLVTGADTVSEALTIASEASEIMKDAGMRLRKWSSNSEAARGALCEEECAPANCEQKILGMKWRATEDEMAVSLASVIGSVTCGAGTKRAVLQASARIFDPLGLIAPFVVRAKIIFQRLWERGIEWDEQLPSDLEAEWTSWCSDLASLRQLCFPRCVVPIDRTCWQLHIFCDASPSAYGCCAYLRIGEGNQTVSVHLILAKSRVAPLKTLSLPRLELMAAVIGTRMATYLKGAISHHMDVYFWTDSMIALHWIRSTAKNWKPFVQNRVTEIQSACNPKRWQHCPGTDNPADCLTRGMKAKSLSDCKLWWHGPEWLRKGVTSWPKAQTAVPCSSAVVEEERKRQTNQLFISVPTTPLMQPENYSSYTRLLRVTAWIRRFANNCRRRGAIAEVFLSTAEIREAENYWIRQAQQECLQSEINTLSRGESIPASSRTVQFQPFLDTDGLLRVTGRLQFSQLPEEIKHPLLLPRDHAVTKLVIQAAHLRTLHGGLQTTMAELREKVWIPSCRQIAKKIIARCPVCLRYRLKPATAPTAPLPSDRVSGNRAFEVTGIDFAGPLYVTSKRACSKSYIALFTCATTRAIHLELVSNLTTDCFLLALRRFVARRGIPSTIYSDNALTFKKASKDIKTLWNVLRSREAQDYCTSKQITWKFIVERAAWWGGWWERMVKSVKISLRKILGRQSLSFEELATVLTDVEATINSRPLTYSTNDPGEPLVITPSHLLTGKRLTALPEVNSAHVPSATASDITRRFKYRQSIVNSFWKRWQREYLLHLRSAHMSAVKPTSTLQVDDIVIVHDDNAPKHMWHTARVVELFQGRDGNVRSCAVKLPSGTTLRRPVQLLYPLETSVK